jgi:hypothetical protein
MTDRFFITCFIVAASLLFIAGVSGVQCSIRPAIINWERRENPIFPIRKKEKPTSTLLPATIRNYTLVPSNGQVRGGHVPEHLPVSGHGNRREHAAPGGLQTGGEAESLHSGAAPISLPPVAAGKSNRNAGNDAAGADL